MTPPRVTVRSWFDPVPARRLAIVRALVFGYAGAWLVVRFGYLLDVAELPSRRYESVGVLRWAPRPSTTVVVALAIVTLVACVTAAAGRRVRIAAPVGAVGMLLLATFTSSHGQVFHTEHLVVLHLIVLAIGSLVEPIPERGGRTSGWPLSMMTAVLALTYVLAGVAKLRWSGVAWVTGDVLQSWIAVDNLRKVLVDDVHSPIGGWMSTVGWIWAPIAVLTLVVELGAPIVFVSWRLRMWWLVAAWAFHVGVLALMAISFPYQLLGFAYVCALPVERLVDRITAAVGIRPRRVAADGRVS
jgi:hypothetical protein